MPAGSSKDYAESYIRDGFAIMDLPDPDAVHEAHGLIRAKLRELTGLPGLELETYHQAEIPEDRHEDILIEMTAWFRSARLAQKVIERNLSVFQSLVGTDIKIERNPFIRVNRPQRTQDNLGMHRDTFYGASPYEISVVIPFVSLPGEASLTFASGSHLLADSMFRVREAPARKPGMVKGSKIHKVGFPYAPKVIDPSDLSGLKTIPLALGQVLAFSLSVVHGSTVNASDVTRVTSDCRVANALAPVDRTILINDEETPYYEPPAALSPVNTCAELFTAENQSPK